MVCTSAKMTSTSAQRTKPRDSGDSKTLVKTVADHKKCDSENLDQLSNTGDRVAAMQEESITEFDDDNSSSFRLYRSGRAERNVIRSKQAFLDREYISEVQAELQKISFDILVLMDKNLIPSTSTGSRRGLTTR